MRSLDTLHTAMQFCCQNGRQLYAQRSTPACMSYLATETLQCCV
jgi:hypothetical protein